MTTTPRKTPNLTWDECAYLDGISSLAGISLTLSIVYVIIGIRFWSSLVIIAGWITWFVLRRKTGRQISRRDKPTDDTRTPPFATIVIIADLILLLQLILARTDIALISPWDILPITVFGLYGLSSFFLALSLRTNRSRVVVPLLILHAAVTYGVALLVYELGFGFDPFIHQATEAYIFQKGQILPLKPFYIGQYALVVGFAHLTRLSVDVLDRLLVPVLGPLIALGTAWIGFRQGWASRLQAGSFAFLGLFLVPLMPLTLTIPYGLAFVFFLAIIFLLPLFPHPTARTTVVLCALAACAAHPLLGIPAVILVSANAFTYYRSPRAWIPWFAGLFTTAAIVGAFFLYAKLHGGTITWPDASSLGSSLQALFGQPYPATEPFLLATLYHVAHVWPWILGVLGVVGFVISGKRNDHHAQLLVASACGTTIAAILLGTLIRLPDIAASEQFEFALRLLAMFPVFLLPGLMLGIETLAGRWKRLSLATASLVLAGCLTANWFLLVPQNNAVAHAVGPGLGRDDIQTVDEIERRADGASYVVLSPQMTSIAALQRFGFDRMVHTPNGDQFLYAIPTGGELYQRYQSVLASPEALSEVFRFTGVQKIFVVVPINWDPAGLINQKLAPLAVSQTTVDASFTIYEFRP